MCMDWTPNNFDEQLLAQISECACVLIILSKGALDRCNDPDDWVRRELLHADRENKPILPLRMPGFEFSDLARLPEPIANISSLHSIEYSHTYFEAAMMRLESALSRYCKRNKSYEVDAIQRGSDKQGDAPERPIGRKSNQ